MAVWVIKLTNSHDIDVADDNLFGYVHILRLTVFPSVLTAVTSFLKYILSLDSTITQHLNSVLIMKLNFLLSLLTLAPRLSLQLLSADGSVPENQAVSSAVFSDKSLDILARQQQQAAPGKKKDSCKACPRRKCSSTAYFRNTATCRCEKCPNGQKAKQRGDGCEKAQDDKKKKKNDKFVYQSTRITSAMLT